MSDTTASTMKFERGSFVSQHGTWKKVSGVLAVAIVVIWYFWGGSASNSSNQHASMAGGVPEVAGLSVAETPATPKGTADEEYRKLFVGTWETDRNGRRELIVNEDGTAKIDVTINNALASMLLGERIVLFLDWKIENGELTMITTGGEPSSKVKMMMSMYGEKRTEKIITLNETMLHHPDDDGGADHIWKRIEN